MLLKPIQVLSIRQKGKFARDLKGRYFNITISGATFLLDHARQNVAIVQAVRIQMFVDVPFGAFIQHYGVLLAPARVPQPL